MEPVSNVIYSVFRGTPHHEDWVLSCLEGAWLGLVGDRLATACKPRRLNGCCLTIEVVDSQWINAVRGLEGQLLKKVREATHGEVQSLEIVSAG